MQTPAEHSLVSNLDRIVGAEVATPEMLPRILNVGAGKSPVIEDLLVAEGRGFTCDRVDVDDCSVDHPNVGDCWRASVEDLQPVPSETYSVVFANYVLEHVSDIRAAAREIFRVVKPGGYFVASVPNPRAPEFRVSKMTPLAVHEWFRGKEAWPTVYAYGNLKNLAAIFETAGFEWIQTEQFSATIQYTAGLPIARPAAHAYDWLLNKIQFRPWMGDVCVIARRPE